MNRKKFGLNHEYLRPLKVTYIRNIITKLDGVEYAAVAKHTMLYSLSIKLLPCKHYYVA